MTRQNRFAMCTLAIHWLLCGLFVVLRPVERHGWLEQKEQARRQGAFTISSAEPLMYLAERPLYQWNTWHGGEKMWVKVIEAPNFLPLVVTKFADAAIGPLLVVSGISYQTQSWVTAGIFLIVSSLQWFAVGGALSHGRLVSKSL